MIIEQTDEEYMADIREQYENEVKPLLAKGYSLTKCFQKLGVNTGRTARRSIELRQMALDDGYKFQGRNHK